MLYLSCSQHSKITSHVSECGHHCIVLSSCVFSLSQASLEKFCCAESEMDVTRENFASLLPSISEAITEASFIAIDGEFTGLTNGSFNVTAYDSPDERYFKLHSNTKSFLLVQFGMDFVSFGSEVFLFFLSLSKSTFCQNCRKKSL